MLPLRTWALRNITRVFEAKSAADCRRAFDETFSQRLEFTVNGTPLPRAGLQQTVLAMCESSDFRLSVDWRNAVAVPSAADQRGGILGGYYVIRNLTFPLTSQPVSPTPTLYEQHKSVSALIESELPDLGVDSRRVQRLTLIATDMPMLASSPSVASSPSAEQRLSV